MLTLGPVKGKRYGLKREAAKQKKRRARTEQARAAVAGFSHAAVHPTDSGLSPAWRIFLSHQRQHLATDLSAELDAFSSPSVVVRRYLSLGSACRELHALVLAEALLLLADRLPASLWKAYLFKAWLGRRDLFRTFFQEPCGFKLVELKAMAESLYYPLSGTKPVLIMRLLEAVHLTKPSAVPADLLLAVAQEKHTCVERNTPLRHIISHCAALLGSRVEPLMHLTHAGRSEDLFSVRKYLSKAFGVVDGAGWQALLARYWALPEQDRPAVR